MPDRPPLPPEIWRRLQAQLDSIFARGATCRLVVIVNCKRGEPVDADILATEPPPVVRSASG